MPMSLNQLLPAAESSALIRELTLDSRKVRPGDLFLAVPGTQQDGRLHIADALARKAHIGGPSVRRQLTEVDKSLREVALSLKPWMQDASDDIDDALTAWEAFDDLEDYLQGSRRFREASRAGLQVFEARLAKGLAGLDRSG